MKSFDCTMLGGGVIGLGIAYEMARRGYRVCVVDARRMGQQTSWAAAGILPAPALEDSPHLDPLDKLHALSRRLLPAWLAAIESESRLAIERNTSGGIHLATRPWERASLATSVVEWKATGVRVEAMTLSDLSRREAALGMAIDRGRILAAYYLPDEWSLRPPRYLRALQAACRARGVEMLEHAALSHWARDGDGWRFEFPETTLRSRQFCIAAGAWSGRLGHALGLPLHVEPMRGQAVLYRAEPGRLRCVLNEGPNYIVPRLDGRLYVGSTVEDTGFVETTTADGLRGIQQFACSLLPELERATVEATWAGLRPASGDGWPFLGAVPHLPGGFVATGHFRAGIALSPATAQLLADVMEGQPPALDLRPFSVTRK